MKARVAEMEAEAAKLREMQAQTDKQTAEEASTEEDKAAADARSVYVGNVRSCSQEDCPASAQSCAGRLGFNPRRLAEPFQIVWRDQSVGCCRAPLRLSLYDLQHHHPFRPVWEPEGVSASGQ
jgi:hypothetical protein